MLGSTLFPVFINDIPDVALIGIHVIDTTVYPSIHNTDNFWKGWAGSWSGIWLRQHCWMGYTNCYFLIICRKLQPAGKKIGSTLHLSTILTYIHNSMIYGVCSNIWLRAPRLCRRLVNLFDPIGTVINSLTQVCCSKPQHITIGNECLHQYAVDIPQWNSNFYLFSYCMCFCMLSTNELFSNIMHCLFKPKTNDTTPEVGIVLHLLMSWRHLP